MTLNLDPAFVARARAKAARDGVTLEQLFEQAISRELLPPDRRAVAEATTERVVLAADGPVLDMRYEDRGGRPLPFPVFYGGTGLMPGIDPRSNPALLDAADADEDERYLRFARGELRAQ